MNTVINNIRTQNDFVHFHSMSVSNSLGEEIAKIFLSFAFFNVFPVGGHARQICLVCI